MTTMAMPEATIDKDHCVIFGKNYVRATRYLYDTLAGGAGYSELAAKYFKDIVEDTLRLLEGCTCDSSCTECLDHFHNQHLKRLLDRRLAASLLRYGLYGTIPQPTTTSAQIEQLGSLNAWLTLDGTHCEVLEDQPANGSALLINGQNSKLALSTYPALLAPDSILPRAPHGVTAYAINESHLYRNLPGVHAEINRQLRLAK